MQNKDNKKRNINQKKKKINKKKNKNNKKNKRNHDSLNIQTKKSPPLKKRKVMD